MVKPVNVYIIFLIICLLSSNKTVIKLNSKPELFTIDKLGNNYVYNNYELSKYSIDGKLLAKFSRLESGKLDFIDASDPLQILLFYKDFNQVVFLDNKLTQLGQPVFLDELDLSSVTIVCKSKQMAVWIYDDYENKLIQYGFNPKGVIQTINLDKFNKNLSDINFLLEKGNELYLNQNDEAIWVFDQFGSKINKLNIKVVKGFQVIDNSVIYNNGKSIFKYNLNDETHTNLKLPDFNIFYNALLSSNNIHILNEDSITIIPGKEF